MTLELLMTALEQIVWYKNKRMCPIQNFWKPKKKKTLKIIENCKLLAWISWTLLDGGQNVIQPTLYALIFIWGNGRFRYMVKWTLYFRDLHLALSKGVAPWLVGSESLWEECQASVTMRASSDKLQVAHFIAFKLKSWISFVVGPDELVWKVQHIIHLRRIYCC